jgi:hypothetical protein
MSSVMLFLPSLFFTVAAARQNGQLSRTAARDALAGGSGMVFHCAHGTNGFRLLAPKTIS